MRKKSDITFKDAVKRRLIYKTLSVFFYVIISSPLFSGTYYVAVNGNDSNLGTENQPWKTIQKAANTLTAGDVVYIKAGIYHERIIPKILEAQIITLSIPLSQKKRSLLMAAAFHCHRIGAAYFTLRKKTTLKLQV